jgi:hypothetical protein
MLRSARQRLIRLTALGMLCRALVPVGCMPAALDDGGPFKFCHGGAAGELWQVLAELGASERASSGVHASHADHAAALEQSGDEPDRTVDHAGWEHCPVGAAFASFALVSDGGVALAVLDHVFEPIESAVPVARAFVRLYQARGPPTL